MWQKYKNKGVQVIGLAIQEAQGGGDPFTNIKGFRQKHKLTYTLASDEKAEIIAKFGFDSIPSIVLLDKNGKYVANPDDVDTLTAKLKKMVK